MVANSDWPSETTQIPDLLKSAPQARAVLDRYGLRGCGGRSGPAESIGYFARAHEVSSAALLAELRDAVQRPATGPRLSVLKDATEPGDAIYRPFFKAGIAVVLTLGAVWGAYLLLRIALLGQFTAVGLHDVNAHGHAQIFGWVGLFVMGFAYQAFPRFKHTALRHPHLAMATLWMMLVGLVVRSVAQPAAVHVGWAAPLAIGASVLEIAAIVLFAAIVIDTWRRSGKRLAFYDGYIVSAIFWFIVQAVYESVYLAATLAAQGEQLVSLVATWQPALRDIQIHGFALLMILGVSQRIFHHFYGLPEPNQRLSRAMLVALNVAVVGEVAGLILMRLAGHAWAGLWYTSVLVLAAATLALVWNWRIFSPTDEADRSLKFLRIAYVWLMVSLAMLVALPVYQFVLLPAFAADSQAAQIGFSHAYYGAIRHAITVGFVSLMIVGVASKVVPTLCGIQVRRLSSLWGPFVLINLGCSLRVVGQTSTDFTAAAFPVAGISGLLEVSGLTLWGVHLWLIMSGRPRLRFAAQPASPPLAEAADGPIGPEHTVGGVLERYPQLLDTFVAFGFTTLTNAHFRNTIARVVTVQQACRRMDVPLPQFLSALNDRRRDSRQADDGARGAALHVCGAGCGEHAGAADGYPSRP